jgi:hypothetical protein
MNEVVAAQPTTGKCPGCGTRCELEVRKRDVKAADGPLALQELMGLLPLLSQVFFPLCGRRWGLTHGN